MENTSHVLVVGEGAHRLADKLGVEEVEEDWLITDYARWPALQSLINFWLRIKTILTIDNATQLCSSLCWKYYITDSYWTSGWRSITSLIWKRSRLQLVTRSGDVGMLIAQSGVMSDLAIQFQYTSWRGAGCWSMIIKRLKCNFTMVNICRGVDVGTIHLQLSGVALS